MMDRDRGRDTIASNIRVNGTKATTRGTMSQVVISEVGSAMAARFNQATLVALVKVRGTGTEDPTSSRMPDGHRSGQQ